MNVKYIRTITRKDGTQLAEFSGQNGNLCVKLTPGMTIEDARREAERKIEIWEERVTRMLGF